MISKDNATPVSQGISVLVVDDDGGIRCLVETLLHRLGFDVDCAATGDEAIQKLRLRAYAAIILDLMLPRTNGFEVIRHLKAVQKYLLSRVIVLTAASDLTLRNFEDEELLWKLMRKPFDINIFAAEVTACAQAHVHQPSPVRSEQSRI